MCGGNRTAHYLTTSAGDLDLAFRPSATQGVSDLERDAVAIESADGARILVASVADIIRSKEAASREDVMDGGSCCRVEEIDA